MSSDVLNKKGAPDNAVRLFELANTFLVAVLSGISVSFA
jgi:hypothetical protein